MHANKKKRFEFIWNKFEKRSDHSRQTALYWLQDLSRLQIPVPYTSHIFDENWKKTPHQKHDDTHKVEEDFESAMPMLRRYVRDKIMRS